MTIERAKELLNKLPPDSDVNLTLKKKKIITSSEVEHLGISRQLLRYYVQCGYVRTVPHGKQKRYYLKDLISLLK